MTDLVVILRMLSVLFSGTQTTTSETTQTSDTYTENKLGKTINLHFSAILEVTQQQG